jgi:hypothetical protein
LSRTRFARDIPASPSTASRLSMLSANCAAMSPPCAQFLSDGHITVLVRVNPTRRDDLLNTAVGAVAVQHRRGSVGPAVVTHLTAQPGRRDRRPLRRVILRVGRILRVAHSPTGRTRDPSQNRCNDRVMRSDAPRLLPIFRSRHQADILTQLLHPNEEYTITGLGTTLSIPNRRSARRCNGWPTRASSPSAPSAAPG